jgi:REP element-mobilizing transposase RayT
MSTEAAPDTKPRRRKPRMPGFDYVGGYAYHVTVVTHDRRPLLMDENATLTVEDLRRAAEVTAFELLVFCVMPDHVHALVLGLDEDANLLRYVQRFKQLSGFRLAKTAKKPIWQQSFYDHALRHHEDVLHVARYIFGNPVEAGLITPDEEWPYSGGTLFAKNERYLVDDVRDGAKASSLHHSATDSP